MVADFCLCYEDPELAASNRIDCEILSDVYWYHPDYVGSNELITDITGEPYQYFFYTPFGETILQEDAFSASYDNPFRFNGKEIDPETGNYYYGARYYNPKWSVWLSVDAMAGNAHNIPLTPFHFSANNPVMIIDPDGNDWVRNEETCEITWNDNAIDQSSTPSGYSHIGDDDAVLAHLGINQNSDYASDRGIGMSNGGIDRRNYSPNGAAMNQSATVGSASAAIILDIMYDENAKSETNSMGKNFNGIIVRVSSNGTNTISGSNTATATVNHNGFSDSKPLLRPYSDDIHMASPDWVGSSDFRIPTNQLQQNSYININVNMTPNTGSKVVMPSPLSVFFGSPNLRMNLSIPIGQRH